MHGLYMSTQHLDEILEPLNWIRACPSCRDEHSCKHSHVLYYVSCNINKYTTFKPHTCPSFRIFIPSNSPHLIKNKLILVSLTSLINLALKSMTYVTCIVRNIAQTPSGEPTGWIGRTFCLSTFAKCTKSFIDCFAVRKKLQWVIFMKFSRVVQK